MSDDQLLKATLNYIQGKMVIKLSNVYLSHLEIKKVLVCTEFKRLHLRFLYKIKDYEDASEPSQVYQVGCYT